MDQQPKTTIVVGVDGSESSIEALRWAASQCACTGADLRVITAWNFPNEPTPFGVVPDFPPHDDHLEKVQARLEQAVVQTLSASPRIEVRSEVIPGRAASVLVDSAKDAALLVVGNRGRGAIAETLLGSVSEYCVRHAHCPVVVIRGTAHHG